MRGAINELSDTLRRIVTCQDAVTLYGNCYVMSHESREQGLSWQQQAKQLAAIELNQHPQFVADQLNERIFEEVCINQIYVQIGMVLSIPDVLEYVTFPSAKCESKI